MFSSLFSSLTNPRISPSAWDPNSTLPQGSTSIVETFTAPISPASSVSLTADTGAWSHGTVVFRSKGTSAEAGGSMLSSLGLGGSSSKLPAGAIVGGVGLGQRSGATTPTQESFQDQGAAGPGGGSKVDPDAPPSYEAIVASVPDSTPAPPAAPQDVKARQLEEGEGLIEVRVEARWNDEKLWDEAKVDLVQILGGGVELVIQTPAMSPSRLTSQLSFHVTFTFPAATTRLARLATRGSQWRTLGEASLAQLRIDEVDVSTANTLVEFRKLRAGKVELVTVNKGIKGEYEVDSLEGKTGNGAVEVEVRAVGKCSMVTSNSPITGTISASSLFLKTVNGKITGTFSSSSTSSPLRLETQNGVLAGTWTGMGGIVASTSNGKIDATCRVRGRLELKTANGAVAGKVECVEGEAGGGTVEVEAKTSNAKIDLDFLRPPPTVQLLATAKTSNSPVRVTHVGAFDGHVVLATSNAEAELKLPQASKATLAVDGRTRKEGVVASGREGETPAWASRLEAKSSNAAVTVSVMS